MSYPINYPTPQGADVQIFRFASSTVAFTTWTKPVGASFVWFTLVGGGGGSNGTSGGGAGAVTNFMCPAFLIPNSLNVVVGKGGATLGSGADTTINYQQKAAATPGYELLNAKGAITSTGGLAMTANAFTAMGFFQSVAGPNGVSGAVTPSSTSFLSGGGAFGSAYDSNYGYSLGSTSASRAGFFQMQPIIVGLGGKGDAVAGSGCGGGVSGGNGGDGLAVIITW